MLGGSKSSLRESELMASPTAAAAAAAAAAETRLPPAPPAADACGGVGVRSCFRATPLPSPPAAAAAPAPVGWCVVVSAAPGWLAAGGGPRLLLLGAFAFGFDCCCSQGGVTRSSCATTAAHTSVSRCLSSLDATGCAGDTHTHLLCTQDSSTSGQQAVILSRMPYL